MNGTARKVKAVYVGVNGVARLVWQSVKKKVSSVKNDITLGSITDSYGRDNIFTEIIEDFVQVPGRGVKAEINGYRYIACNFRQLAENKIIFDQVINDDLVIYLVKEKQVIGYAVMGDSIREEVPKTLVNLRKLGANGR